jgi:hypothetical protein
MTFPTINYITSQSLISIKSKSLYTLTTFLHLLFITLFSNAQAPITDDSFLPNLDSLKISTKIFYLKQANADLAQFQYATKGKVLKYIPSLGYNVATASPIFTLNISDLFSATNTKRQIKAQEQRIILLYETQYNQNLIEVTQLHEALSNQVVFYNTWLLITDLEAQKLSIIKKDYENNLVPPSTWLNAQIQFENLSNSIKQKLFELYKARSELLTKAKKGDWVALPVLSNNSLNSYKNDH